MSTSTNVAVDKQNAAALAEFYRQLPGVLHPLDYVKGVIFAVAAAPEIPMPQQWFAWVFKQHGQLTDGNQADALADCLMDELKRQLSHMRSLTQQDSYQLDYHFPQDNQVTNPLSQWLTGLLFAHQQLQPVWQGAWQQMQEKMLEDVQQHQKDLRHCLSMFSTFADMPLAIRQASEKGNPALAEQLPIIFNSLPLALAKYIKLSGKLVNYLPDQFEQFQG